MLLSAEPSREPCLFQCSELPRRETCPRGLHVSPEEATFPLSDVECTPKSPPRACGSFGSSRVSLHIAKLSLAYPQKAFIQPNEKSHIDAVSIFPFYFPFLLQGLSGLSTGLHIAAAASPVGTWALACQGVCGGTEESLWLRVTQWLEKLIGGSSDWKGTLGNGSSLLHNQSSFLRVRRPGHI